MFNVELFYNTGFNSVNIPDSPDLLYSYKVKRSGTHFPALDIFQIDFLTSIKIKVRNEDDVIGADYLCLSEDIPDTTVDGVTVAAHTKRAFYSIVGYQMSSIDVAELLISEDAFTTLGGVNALTVVEGMTVRHHVADEDDKFGAYTEDDELLVPLDALEVHTGGDPMCSKVPYHNRDLASHYLTNVNPSMTEDGTRWYKTLDDRDSPGSRTQNGIGVYNEGRTGVFLAVEEPYNNGSSHYDDWNNGHVLAMSTTELNILSYGGRYINPVSKPDPNSGDENVYYFPETPQAGSLTIRYPSPYVDPITLVPALDSVYRGESIDRIPGPIRPKKRFLNGVSVFEAGVPSLTSPDKYYAPYIALKYLRGLGIEDSVIDNYILHPMAGQMRRTPTTVFDHEGTDTHDVVTPGASEIYGYINLFCTYDRDVQLNIANTVEYTGNPVRRMHKSECYDYLWKPGVGMISNMRVLYGKFRSYCITATGTGSSLIAKPEDIILKPFTRDDGGKQYNDLAPTLAVITDPSPDGAPYFNIVQRRASGAASATYTSGSNMFLNILSNAIKGAPWKKAPIKFNGYSGAMKDALGLKASREYSDYLNTREGQNLQRVAGGNEYNVFGGGNALMTAYVGSRNPMGYYDVVPETGESIFIPGGTASEGSFAGSAGAATGAAGSLALSAGISAARYGLNHIADELKWNAYEAFGASKNNTAWNSYAAANKLRNLQKAQEMSQFNLTHSYSTPNIKFLPQTSIREMNGNAVLYTRLTPSMSDLKRFDDILDRYGYKVSEPLKDEFLTNMNRQNYIECRGARLKMKNNQVYLDRAPQIISDSLTTQRASKVLLDEAANQLNDGVRIWHVANTSSYKNR